MVWTYEESVKEKVYEMRIKINSFKSGDDAKAGGSAGQDRDRKS